MNTIASIEKHLSEAKQLSCQYSEKLFKDPDNFSCELSLSTVQSHIADLHHQLKIAKEDREKEVVQLRLRGPKAEHGSIPVLVLAALLKNFHDAISSSAYKITKGFSPKGTIPKGINNTLNLNFSGIAPGSTRLFITGETSPDLFGASLIQESFENTFSILNAENPDDLSLNASKMGKRAAQKINSMLKILDTNDLEVEFSWHSPSESYFEWNGKKDRISSFLNTFGKINISDPEIIHIAGKVEMISMGSKIDVKDNSGFVYHASYPTELLPAIQTLHIGDNIDGVIEKTTVTNRVSTIHKDTYALISIKTEPK